jgi:hypothetical protein
MSGRGGLDPKSKLGRAVFALVDATRKATPETRARIVRIHNAIAANPDDALVRFAVRGDLDLLMRDSRLNHLIRAIWKALPN